MEEETKQVEWEGEGYSKHSALQEYYASHFISQPKFPKFERNENSTIIDIGCGDGRITRKIFDIVGGKVYGVDVTPQQISFASAKHSVNSGENQLKYFVLDATELDTLPARFPNDIATIEGTVDRVVSFNCIHWIANHQKLFQQIFKVLKSGGRTDIMFGWSADGHEEEVKALVSNLSYLSENGPKEVVLPTAPWFDNEFKNRVLKSFLNEGGDVNYQFGPGAEGTEKLLKIYEKMLREIGFEVEGFTLYNYPLSELFLYKTIEDFEGFISAWFPKVAETEEAQKTLIRRFLDVIKSLYEIKDENGAFLGFGIPINNLHLHLRKP